MDDNVNPGHRPAETICIAYITDEETQAGIIEPADPHLVLFEFVAAEDDQFLGLALAQHGRSELFAEGAGAAGD